MENNPAAPIARIDGSIQPGNRLDGKGYAGSFPATTISLVREWLILNRDEIAEDWALALARKSLKPIAADCARCSMAAFRRA